MQNYDYPFDPAWTHEEIAVVLSLWNAVEAAYENGIPKEEFLKAYRSFKEIVPSKGEEKRYGEQFEKKSGYSLYQAVKTVKASEKSTVRITKTTKQK